MGPVVDKFDLGRGGGGTRLRLSNLIEGVIIGVF